MLFEADGVAKDNLQMHASLQIFEHKLSTLLTTIHTRNLLPVAILLSNMRQHYRPASKYHFVVKHEAGPKRLSCCTVR